MSGKTKPSGDGKRIIRINLSWFYLPLILLIAYLLYCNRDVRPQKVEWAEVKSMVASGDVKEILFIRNDFKGSITIKPDRLAKYADHYPAQILPKSSPHFTFLVSMKFDAELEFEALNAELPEDSQVKIIIENDDKVWSHVLEWIFFPLIIIFFWIWMIKGMNRGGSGGPGGGVFNVGKATGKLADKNEVNVTFKDVAGLYGAKDEVMEIVDFLKKPDKYTSLGGKIPKGALLVGPPGTGKTLLAKAVAGEANVPFFSISGSDFVEMFVGVGASRVRDLFKQAKEKAPCIVFIDEIDAVGRARGKNAGFSSNDERENTLNQLLTEMDGFGTNSGVIVLAATNRVDILDKALMRAGRFDRQIHVTLPNLYERKEIFNVHLRKLRLSSDFDLDIIAKHTAGFSGADIANVCNEAALTAARRNKSSVESSDFIEAIDRIVGGIERKKTIMTPKEKRLTAFHEVGHAVAGWLLDGCAPVLKVSIIPRGEALGTTWYLPDEKVTTTKSEIMDKMCSLVAGRVAEEIANGGVPCTGALNDFERLTKMAYSMVKYFGMSEKVGNLSYYDSTGESGYDFQKPYSEKTAEIIDAEAKAISDEVTSRTKSLLLKHWTEVETLVEKLLLKEVITAEDVEKVLGPKAGEHGDARLNAGPHTEHEDEKTTD